MSGIFVSSILQGLVCLIFIFCLRAMFGAAGARIAFVVLLVCYIGLWRWQVNSNDPHFWDHIGLYVPCPLFSAKDYGERGRQRLEIGSLDAALSDMNEAIRQEPAHSVYYATRGQIFFALNKDDEARKDFDQAISLDNKNINAYAGRGRLHAKLKESDAANSDLTHAVKLATAEKDPDGFLQISKGYLEQLDYNKAMQALRKASLLYKAKNNTREYKAVLDAMDGIIVLQNAPNSTTAAQTPDLSQYNDPDYVMQLMMQKKEGEEEIRKSVSPGGLDAALKMSDEMFDSQIRAHLKK